MNNYGKPSSCVFSRKAFHMPIMAFMPLPKTKTRPKQVHRFKYISLAGLEAAQLEIINHYFDGGVIIA